MSLNKKKYTGKRVLIIGKGNSGFETADHLTEVASLIHIASPNPIKMAWKSHHIGHLRAVNNNLLDTYQLKSQNAVINSELDKIVYRKGNYEVTFAYTLANDEVEMIKYDHVIACTGFSIDTSIFSKSCQPKLKHNDRLPALHSWYESKNISDLYFAGVLMQDRDYKKKQTSVVHGFRYNVKFLADYLEHRYHQRPIHSCIIPATVKDLTEEIVRHANRSSALWQQTGYICDLIVHKEKEESFYYYDCVPHDFMNESGFTSNAHYFTLTLEFGQHIIDKSFNTFAIERVHMNDFKHAHLSTGIHPIVRHFYKNQLISEHHLIEDFDSVWCESVHVEPLQKYLAKEIRQIQKQKTREKTKQPLS